jgi:hypothetical protein
MTGLDNYFSELNQSTTIEKTSAKLERRAPTQLGVIDFHNTPRRCLAL